MNNMRNKILSLLVLLLTAATGARATDPKVYTEPVAISSLHVGDILATGFSLTPASYLDVIYFDANRSKQDDSPMDSQWGVSLSYIKSYGDNSAMTFTTESDPPSDLTATPVDANGNDGNAWVVTSITNYKTPMGDVCVLYVSGTYYEPPITVEPVSGKTNEWTLSMPASDVLLTPQYATVAKWAVESAGTPEEKTLLPAAAEGVIAGTTAHLIVEGTVATTTIGETTTAQGTVKYAVTDTKTTAPALADFRATVPTAAKYDDAKTVYVWYYIEGIEPENFADRTAQNTFDNSDICTEPIEVSVLTNKFTLTLDPAPVEKVTVTIDNSTVTDAAQLQAGKIPNVQMGKTVKLAPKTGYKLRKVEVKKTAARVTTPPQANTFTTASDNYEDALVTAGAAEGGTVWYAFTTTKIQPDDANFPFDTPPTLYNLLSFLARPSLPAGTYYVWYKVVGNPGYSDSEVAYVALTVTEAQ